MRTKVTLYEAYNWNNHEILILIELGRKTKQWHKEYEKYQCCTQSREAFYKKLFFKISQYSQENNCVGVFFLIKMQTFRPATLLKGYSNINVFLTIFRKNFQEQLFWRTSVNRRFWEFFLLCCFPTWTNNITGYIRGEDVSQKQNKKYYSKTQLYERKLTFSWCSLLPRFSLILHCTSGGFCPA